MLPLLGSVVVDVLARNGPEATVGEGKAAARLPQSTSRTAMLWHFGVALNTYYAPGTDGRCGPSPEGACRRCAQSAASSDMARRIAM